MQVRWEELFTRLDMELQAQERAELSAEVADRTRREHGEVHFVDRLRALVGSEVQLDVAGAGTVQGKVQGVGLDWVLLSTGAAMEALVLSAAIVGLRGATRAAQLGGGGLTDRMRLTMVLRSLARDRREVLLTRCDGTLVTGTIDRVGADYVEVAEHPAGEARRATSVRTVRLLPLRAVAMIKAH